MLAGKIIQADDRRWWQRVFDWEIDVSHRGRGHPRARSEDDIRKFIASEGLGYRSWQVVAKNERQWKQLEDKLTSS